MSADIIYLILYNSITATVIASVALVVSLYLFQKELAAHGKTKTTTKTAGKKKRVTRKKSLKFSLPAQIQAIGKDFGALLLIVFFGLGVFALQTQAAEWEVKKYLGLGLRYVQYVAAGPYEETAASVVELDNVSGESETEVPAVEEEGEAVAEEAEEDVVVEKVAAKPTVQKASPPVVISPPPPVIVPLILKDPPRPDNSEASGPAPDATAASFSHYGSALVEGGNISFSVIVSNKGTKDMELPFNTQIHIDEGNDGWTERHFTRLETRALKVGEQETKIWKSAWQAKTGTHRAYVCADSDNALLETNEKNNCAEIIFTVEGQKVSGDLVVEELTMIPPNPSLNHLVAFSARIVNKAYTPAKKSYAYLIIDDKNALPYKKFVSGLIFGESEKIEWGTIWKATAGSHSYKVCADGGNDVLESNEENNCSVGTLVVSE